MIECFSNLCEGDTSNFGRSGSCSCFLLYFKVDPSTCLWVTELCGPLFYSPAEFRVAYLMEIVIKRTFSH